jgi:predicted MFS family arabinose efflux permease
VFTAVCVAVVRDAPLGLSVPRISGAQVIALLKNRNIVLVALGGAGALYGTLGFVAWASALLTVAHGLSPVVAGSVLMGFGIGAFLSKPLFGWLYDALHRYARLVAVVDLALFILLLAAFGKCSSTSGYFLIAPFLGAAAYGYTPLLIGLYTQASGPGLAGAAAGFVNTIWSVGSFVSPMVAGYVFAHGRSLDLTLAVIAAGPLAGAVFLCCVRQLPNAKAS